MQVQIITKTEVLEATLIEWAGRLARTADGRLFTGHYVARRFDKRTNLAICKNWKELDFTKKGKARIF